MQELLTIAISFVLYIFILLRVRGSTVISKNNVSGHGDWVLRFPFPRYWGNWHKSLDAQNSKENGLVSSALKPSFIWDEYLSPSQVSYTAIMLPMTLIRILQFKYNVPFVLITISGIVFNSMGMRPVFMHSWWLSRC